jgi:hypothetical protein
MCIFIPKHNWSIKWYFLMNYQCGRQVATFTKSGLNQTCNKSSL